MNYSELIESKMVRWSLVCSIMIVLIAPLAATENVGTTGFSFLRVPYSARAAAMANAYTGMANDEATVFFNPAGLVQMSDRQLSSTYINYFEGFHGGAVIFTFPVQEATQLALFTQYLGTNSITRTEVDDQGNFIGTAGTFGANNMIFGLSGSRYIHEMLNIGVTAKVIREQLDDHSATAIAADIGVLHQTTNDKLKLGAALKNIGTQLTYHTKDQYKEDLPIGFTVGFHYFPHQKFSATVDVNKPFESDFAVAVGLEFAVHPMLDLRGGYNANAKDWRLGGDYDILSGMSLGFGVTRDRFGLDYAVSSYGDLGFINQITLKYSY